MYDVFRGGLNFLRYSWLACGFFRYRSSFLIYLFSKFAFSLCTEARGTSTAAISSRVEAKRLGTENGLRSLLQRHVSERDLPSTCPWDYGASQSQDGKWHNGKSFSLLPVNKPDTCFNWALLNSKQSPSVVRHEDSCYPILVSRDLTVKC